MNDMYRFVAAMGTHEGQPWHRGAEHPLVWCVPFDAGGKLCCPQHRLQDRVLTLLEWGDRVVGGHPGSLDATPGKGERLQPLTAGWASILEE